MHKMRFCFAILLGVAGAAATTFASAGDAPPKASGCLTPLAPTDPEFVVHDVLGTVAADKKSVTVVACIASNSKATNSFTINPALFAKGGLMVGAGSNSDANVPPLQNPGPDGPFWMRILYAVVPVQASDISRLSDDVLVQLDVTPAGGQTKRFAFLRKMVIGPTARMK